MSIRSTLFAAALTLASSGGAYAGSLRPIQAQSIQLGDVSGVAYYTVERDGFRSQRAKLFDFVDFVAGAQANFHAIGDAAFHHANEDDGATVRIEPRIENQRLQRILRAAFR